MRISKELAMKVEVRFVYAIDTHSNPYIHTTIMCDLNNTCKVPKIQLIIPEKRLIAQDLCCRISEHYKISRTKSVNNKQNTLDFRTEDICA